MAPVSTLRINRAAAQTRKLSNILRTSKADLLETDPDKNPYHDVSLHMNPEKKRRPKRELEFVIPGEIARMAERRREKAEVAARDEGYRKELREAAQRCDEIPVLPPYRAIGGAGRGEEGVDVEWWDAPFVQRDKEGKVITDVRDGLEGYVLRDERITQYVHHPASIQPAVIKSVPEVKLMLTKEERKKLRRQKREEAHKEQTDMIAAGLMPPPAPKVRLGNLVRVLANEATADPTAVEKRVREQVAERRRKHLEANEMRKRTPAEKMEKVREKHQKDREGGLMANVYRMDVEVQARHRYKVDVNARQSGISGCLVVCEGGWNVVVVEGGAKALRKYNRLMLRRIDWTGEKRDEGDGDGDGEKAGCVLVWQGSISSAAFEGFSTLSVRNEGGARSHFRKHQVEHYWDLCTQATPTGNTSLGVRQAI